MMLDDLKVIRQISDYSLDELNEHIKIVNSIPDYIMNYPRREYWVNQIIMRKNLILDGLEKQSGIFDRHVKVQKWIDNTKPFYIDHYDNNKIYEINDHGVTPISYHNFYFKYREDIESYFLNAIKNGNTIKTSLNNEVDIEQLDVEKIKEYEEKVFNELS